MASALLALVFCFTPSGLLAQPQFRGNSHTKAKTTAGTSSASARHKSNAKALRPSYGKDNWVPATPRTPKVNNGASRRHPGNSQAIRPPHGNNNRPSGNHNGYRPNGNSGHRPPGTGIHRPGNSVHRPGGSLHRPPTSLQRPGKPAYTRPGYRPPRPGGGYWGPPVLPAYRWRHHAWHVPARPVYVVTGVPTIGSVLGLTFGSLVDYGINALFSSGYNVLGYADNAVYLSNVPMLGFSWPYVSVNYVDGRMRYTQFQYWTPAYDTARFDRVYADLCSTYGTPLESGSANGITSFTWWGGSNTGYVTLQFGLGDDYNGGNQYYTNLIYGDGN